MSTTSAESEAQEYALLRYGMVESGANTSFFPKSKRVFTIIYCTKKQ